MLWQTLTTLKICLWQWYGHFWMRAKIWTTWKGRSYLMGKPCEGFKTKLNSTFWSKELSKISSLIFSCEKRKESLFVWLGMKPLCRRSFQFLAKYLTGFSKIWSKIITNSVAMSIMRNLRSGARKQSSSKMKVLSTSTTAITTHIWRFGQYQTWAVSIISQIGWRPRWFSFRPSLLTCLAESISTWWWRTLKKVKPRRKETKNLKNLKVESRSNADEKRSQVGRKK